MRLRHPRDPYILSTTHVALAYHNINDDPIHSMVNWRHDDDHAITAIPSLIPPVLNAYAQIYKEMKMCALLFPLSF